MTTSEVSLLDTNVLVYAADENSPFFRRSKNLRDKGLAGELSLCIGLQNLSEFFAVITDPKRVDSPRNQEEALAEIRRYLYSKKIIKIYPRPASGEMMVELLKRYPVKKQEIFDLQVVATMLANGVRRICTFNGSDFARFAEIEAIEP